MPTKQQFQSHFDVLGLSLKVTADHKNLAEIFNQDLRMFRVRKPPRKVDFEIQLMTLPVNGQPLPAPFQPYQEVTSSAMYLHSSITRYARSSVIVLSDQRSGTIRAGISLQSDCVPDPAYHYAFTQPIQISLKRRGLFFLHAACVAENGDGVLLVGQAMAGKSTLSVSCASSGFKFLGDEQPIVSMHRGQLKVDAFHRRVRLERFMAKKFPFLRRVLKSDGNSRVVFAMEEIWPECLGFSCRPKVLVFPEFHANGRLKLSLMDRSTALGRLLKDDHFVWYHKSPLEGLSRKHLALFETMVRLPVYRLIYGPDDLTTVPVALRQLLKRHR